MNSKQLRLFLCAVVAALLAGMAVPALAASGGASEAARRLARELPADAGQLAALREPAATTQEQAEVAFDELRQMSFGASLDPHYLPALLAAGRTFLAASGQDPLTRTTVNPDYLGLERELALSEERLAGSARTAAKLSGRVRRLTRQLARTRRRADRLARRPRQGAPARRRR